MTYIIDRNVNYTNLCVTACKFCNFFRPRKSHEAHTLSRLELAHKFSETVAMGGVQILLQGGVNPDLPLTYYEDLFRWTKSNFPLALHALSPEEISFISRMENLPIRLVLERLVAWTNLNIFITSWPIERSSVSGVQSRGLLCPALSIQS